MTRISDTHFWHSIVILISDVHFWHSFSILWFNIHFWYSWSDTHFRYSTHLWYSYSFLILAFSTHFWRRVPDLSVFCPTTTPAPSARHIISHIRSILCLSLPMPPLSTSRLTRSPDEYRSPRHPSACLSVHRSLRTSSPLVHVSTLVPMLRRFQYLTFLTFPSPTNLLPIDSPQS